MLLKNRLNLELKKTIGFKLIQKSIPRNGYEIYNLEKNIGKCYIWNILSNIKNWNWSSLC